MNRLDIVMFGNSFYEELPDGTQARIDPLHIRFLDSAPPFPDYRFKSTPKAMACDGPSCQVCKMLRDSKCRQRLKEICHSKAST